MHIFLTLGNNNAYLRLYYLLRMKINTNFESVRRLIRASLEIVPKFFFFFGAE